MSKRSQSRARGLLAGAALAGLVLVAGCGARHGDLRAAFAGKDYARVESLVRAERHPDFIIDVEHASPLMLAAKLGSPELVRTLLDLGASPNFAAPDGSTATTVACAEANPVIVQMLIAAGGDLRHQSRWGDCLEVLHEWHGAGRKEAETLRLLEESGLDVVKEAKERTIAKEPLLHYLLVEGKADVLIAYLELGARADVRDERGRTLLVGAVARQDFVLLRALLAAGADPRVKDRDGNDVVTAAKRWHRRYARALETETEVVTGAAFDPKLSTPEERVAALDAVMPDLEQRVAAVMAAAREERRREAEEYLRNMPPPAPAPRTAPVPKPARAPSICDRPDIAACRAQGRTCDSCWISSLVDPNKKASWLVELGSSGGDTTTCKSGATPCFGSCCGAGLKCCRSEGGGGGMCLPSSHASGNPRSCPWGYK